MVAQILRGMPSVTHGRPCISAPKRSRVLTVVRGARAEAKGFGSKPEAQSMPKEKPQKVPFQFDMNQMDASNQPAQPPPIPQIGHGPPLDDLMGEDKSGMVLPELPEGTPGRIEIAVTMDDIMNLDLTAARAAIDPLLARGPEGAQDVLARTVGFKLEYKKEQGDPREMCEIPDVRLWYLRLDAQYPWLVVALDWRAGELARYTAMLIPHQISRKDGLVYNPEGLELFLNGKLFVSYNWLRDFAKVPKPAVRVKEMMLMMGFQTADELFNLI
mmetsp:Transcript_11272/g.21334  ORF Transcript_11272/g.21334 Transcript_11272/m.21334 type:complete len:272 (-) Transcript_11272:151-966(-)|eukprot:CAMPEP_0114253806 /NCGR_PEP_ID=MMETSP0058-20121206/16614_1 /TAXON_ID=36894 /ORGANISM="Pyramimonas parkeae, CCMP726" /LENGTH=271 /DNA_ID=CAMNT_0001367927 /DNA_START=80 /DNA_END=895 /DNA_ORIENTATION=-